MVQIEIDFVLVDHGRNPIRKTDCSVVYVKLVIHKCNTLIWQLHVKNINTLFLNLEENNLSHALTK